MSARTLLQLGALALSAAVAPGLAQSPEAEPLTIAHPAPIAEPQRARVFDSKLNSLNHLNGPTHSVGSRDARVASAIGPFDLHRLSLADFGDVEP